METNHASNSLEKYNAVVTLRDGSTLHLRAIQREDEEKMLALFHRFSLHTVYLRFHHAFSEMTREEVRRFCTVDYDTTFALVATIGEDAEEKVVAVGRYYRLGGRDAAEVAFVVEDAYQGKGVGMHLLKQLATLAREKGIRVFEGLVLAENKEMIKLFKKSGFRLATELEHGVYRMVLDITRAATTNKNLASNP